jgi:hypothetical protein
MMGLNELVLRRQVHPELEGVDHPAVLGVLVVDQASPRRGPLSVALSNRSLMAVIVIMLDPPFNHIGDCLDFPMRMPIKNSHWESILHK